MRDVSIIGMGQTKVKEHWNKSLRDLATEAILAALQDAHADHVDALYVGNMLSGVLGGQEQLATLIADAAGMRGVEALKIEAAQAGLVIADEQRFGDSVTDFRAMIDLAERAGAHRHQLREDEAADDEHGQCGDEAPFDGVPVSPGQEPGPPEHQRGAISHREAIAPRNIVEPPEKPRELRREHRPERRRVRDRRHVRGRAGGREILAPLLVDPAGGIS